CAEAGASEHQLMALFGWANPKQAAAYTKKVNRARLEAAAAPLLEAPSSNAAGPDSNAAAERDSNKSVPLFAGVPAGRTLTPKHPSLINGIFQACVPLPGNSAPGSAAWRPLRQSLGR